MVLQYAANAGGAENLRGVGEGNVALTVAFAFKRQHRIRPDRNAAIDHAGKMDAEKRHCRIGDRVDQMVNDPVVPRGQTKVLAAERADNKTGLHAQHFDQPIRHQPCTADKRSGFDFPTLRGANDNASGMFC